MSLLGYSFETKIGVRLDITPFALEITDRHVVDLELVDTACMEREGDLNLSFFRDITGFLVVFDVSNDESFKDLEKWLELIGRNGSLVACKVIVGNKVDLKERKVSYEAGYKFASDRKLPYFETSAKEGTNVKAAFEKLCKDVLDIEKGNL
uniref:Uncharacterized protein n=1 Tax=Arcella intermedia TaxID=1963864 RepID=A0A6B2LM25_9EUKA